VLSEADVPKRRTISGLVFENEYAAAKVVWHQRQAIAELGTALQATRTQLELLTQSRSWRLTAPLRRLALFARHLLYRRSSPDWGALPEVDETAAEPGQRTSGARLLLLDVTSLASRHGYGGIARVTRSVLAELLFAPPPGWEVVPVALSQNGYFGAAARLDYCFGEVRDSWSERRISAAPGDVFIGLDLNRDHHVLLDSEMRRLREEGARINFVVYDLLPLEMPHVFPTGVGVRFESWLRVVAAHAQVAACISSRVAQTFEHWLCKEGNPNGECPQIRVFPLGVDRLQIAACGGRLKKNGVPEFLMVGTLEPRKRYDLALDAMERLWDAGKCALLTIVGRQGWSADELVARLLSHPEFGRRLRWVKDATDGEVCLHYASADCFLSCSQGEGFGLPIIEARAHGLHLILRDIPEFREVGGVDASFFGSRDAGEPYEVMLAWLTRKDPPAATPAVNQVPDWADSAAELLQIVDLSPAPLAPLK
jgi:glycosyltransferase involved in cell wall biosynthesis